MERLDAAERLIDEAEAAVSVPVRTRGSGEYSTPVILLSNVSAYPRIEGNTKQAGYYDGNGDGNPDGILLALTFEASATLEARSQNEVESYQLAKAVYDRLMPYTEFPASFHAGMNDMSVGELKQTGFQAPLPEPVYKHSFSVTLDYSDTLEVPFSVDTGQPIESIIDDISTL